MFPIICALILFRRKRKDARATWNPAYISTGSCKRHYRGHVRNKDQSTNVFPEKRFLDCECKQHWRLSAPSSAIRPYHRYLGPEHGIGGKGHSQKGFGLRQLQTANGKSDNLLNGGELILGRSFGAMVSEIPFCAVLSEHLDFELSPDDCDNLVGLRPPFVPRAATQCFPVGGWTGKALRPDSKAC